MKRREYFLYKSNDVIQQLLNVSSVSVWHYFEIIPWMQNVYTLVYQPGHKGALFAFKSV